MDKLTIKEIKKLKPGKKDILVMKTNTDIFSQSLMNGIAEELREKCDWEGILLLMKKGEEIETLDLEAQKRVYEFLRKKFETPAIKLLGRHERRKFNFKVCYNSSMGQIACIPIQHGATGRAAGNGMIINDDKGDMPMPPSPEWKICPAEVIVYVQPEKKKGEITIEKR